MKELLKVVRDGNESDKTRIRAAEIGLLLSFAEPIDEKTVRITKDTVEKAETYLALLRFHTKYPSPVEAKVHFDSQRDKALIDKGSHFFCLTHLTAVVIENQSRDPNYCSDCYKELRNDKVS